ncbi:MAG: class I SAM-dependent methyltransferase [Candidatus Methanomethylicaceae archaeon]
MLTIDIGCGDNKRGDIGVDIRKTRCVDIIADARFLPFKTESFDYVFSDQVIEHFSHREIKNIMLEWIRILKKGGTIEILCPDLRARAFLFFLNPSWQNIKNIYGGQEYEYNCHHCGFSFGLLKNLLESCGVRKVKRVISGYKGVPFIPNCLHVKGIKS